MSEQDAHSPLPWSVEYRDGRAASMYGHHVRTHANSRPGITDGRDAICDVRGASDAEARANARFIVTACNAHHDLIAALKAVRGAVDPYARAQLSSDLIEQVDAALAKAEGK